MKKLILTITAAFILTGCSEFKAPTGVEVGGFSKHILYKKKDKDEKNPYLGFKYGKWVTGVYDNSDAGSTKSLMVKKEVYRKPLSKHTRIVGHIGGAVYSPSNEAPRWSFKPVLQGEVQVHNKHTYMALGALPGAVTKARVIMTLNAGYDF